MYIEKDMFLDQYNPKKIAVVSDFHFGEDGCLFETNEENIKNFILFVKSTLKTKPKYYDVLILLGDIFDLSLAPIPKIFEVFKKFINELSNSGLVKNIVYIPGNHDHHFWVQVNEKYHIIDPASQNKDIDFSMNGGYLPHVNYNYCDTFLNGLLNTKDNEEIDIKFHVAYPNILWKPKLAEKLFIFTHGHLFDATFTLISSIYEDAMDMKIEKLNQLEGINSGWTEFVWYFLGQAELVGANGLLDKLYYDIQQGTTQALEKMVHNLFKNRIKKMIDEMITSRGINAFVSNISEKVVLDIFKFIIKKYAGSLEIRKANDRNTKIDDPKLFERITDYYKKFILGSNVLGLTDINDKNVCLLFGHTHSFGYAQIPDSIECYNTGSWLREKDGDEVDSYLISIDSHGNVVPHFTKDYGFDF